MAEELRKTRRELAAARRTLQECRFRTEPAHHGGADRSGAAGSDEPLGALGPGGVRLAEELRQACVQVTAARNTYSGLRYEVWGLAQAGILGTEWPLDVLENVVRAAATSQEPGNEPAPKRRT
jgi:hypothetical protein